MMPNMLEDLIRLRIPALKSAMSNYRVVSFGLGSDQQKLLSSEVERRIRQSNAILLRVVQLVSPAIDRALFTITEVVMHGTEAGQHALDVELQRKVSHYLQPILSHRFLNNLA